MPPNGCKYWVTYDSIAGEVSYCEVAAHGLRLSARQLEAAGCTPARRRECMKIMQLTTGLAENDLAAVGLPAGPRLAPEAAGQVAMVGDSRPALSPAAPALTPTQAVAAPPEVAATVVQVAEKKAQSTWAPLVVLGVLAGAYIAFGAQLATVVTSDLGKFLGDGFSRLMGGLVFSVGLVLVVVAGGELFTGNSLMASGVLGRKFGLKRLLWHWGLVYAANFAGAILVAALMAASGLWASGSAASGVRAVSLAAGKVGLGWGEALVRGILCNWLVCLAVWLALAARDGISKLMACVLPVTAFVASGFEHSIANMYFVPAGILAKQSPAIAGALAQAVGSEQAAAMIGNLTWSRFLSANLVPVTIGNVIGGVVLVASAYWFAYGRPREAPKLAAVRVPVRTAPQSAVGGE